MRLDVQGLRGIAIIFVLLFHLFPKHFINGYIGVDIFFVISGYLISVIFAKETKITLSSVGLFYYRRIKRIFPLYYLVLPIVFIGSQFALGRTWIILSNQHVFYALAFLKNMETIWNEKDYFNAVGLSFLLDRIQFKSTKPSKDPYLHTWSLSVEIQFYLLAPIIFLFVEKLRKKSLQVIFLTFLVISTFAHHTLTPSIFAFNYTLARLWQLTIGILAHQLHDENEQLISQDLVKKKSILKDISSWIMTILLLLTLLPIVIDPFLLRTSITTATSILLWLRGENGSCRILKLRPLVYIGDLSYIIYLIHWPVIVFIGASTVSQVYIALVIILLASIFLHYCYENIYRTFTMKKIGILLTVLLLFNIGSVFMVKTCPRFQKLVRDWELVKSNTTFNKAIEENLYYAATPVHTILKCNFSEDFTNPPELSKPWGVCEYPKGNGTKSILVIGNSYAINHANVVQEEFRGNYKRFFLLSSLGLQVIHDEYVRSPHPFFHNQWRIVMKIIEHLKPEVIYVITRYQDSQKRPLYRAKVQEDYIVQEYNEKIEILEKIADKVLIQGPHPLYQMHHLNNFIEAMKKGVDLNTFHLQKKEADEEMQWARVRTAAISCHKCVIYDTAASFLANQFYLGYDPDTLLSFLDNDLHLTKAGMDKLRPLYRQLAEDL